MLYRYPYFDVVSTSNWCYCYHQMGYMSINGIITTYNQGWYSKKQEHWNQTFNQCCHNIAHSTNITGTHMYVILIHLLNVRYLRDYNIITIHGMDIEFWNSIQPMWLPFKFKDCLLIYPMLTVYIIKTFILYIEST